MQGVVDYGRINIKRSEEEIKTHSYILTFNKSLISKIGKTGYDLKKIK